MKKVFAGIVVVAILIVSLPSSTSFSPATARPEIVSFGIQAGNIILTPPELYEQAKSLVNFHDGKGTPTEAVNTGMLYVISRGDGECIRESYYFKVCTDHTGSNTLGDITRTAIEKYVAENDFSDKKNLVTLFEFVLLGDPALELAKGIHKTD